MQKSESLNFLHKKPQRELSQSSLFYHWAGALSFERSLVAQKNLKEYAKKSQFCFFGFESSHPVISLGLRSNLDHILWPHQKLKEQNISAVRARRGGEGTLHSPGQIVIYPIVHLPSLALKVKDFISALEQITQGFLKDLGIRANKRDSLAGLYTNRGKICFFGIHISEGVNQQGLSINVDNDLSLFDSIKSCGQEKRSHDKISFYVPGALNKERLFLKWCDRAFDFFNLRLNKKA